MVRGGGGFGEVVKLSDIALWCHLEGSSNVSNEHHELRGSPKATYDLCSLTITAGTYQAPIILGPLVATCVTEDLFRTIAGLRAVRAAASALRCHTSLSALIGCKGRVSKACEEPGGLERSERQTDGSL